MGTKRASIGAGLLAGLLFAAGSTHANPQGMTVVSGSAHATQHGSVLQITTSGNAVLNWNSFNIPAGDTTVFRQPSANSIVFNNIGGANPSAIFGTLRANGIVVLENQHGFYFGPNAFVKAGGLVVTTAAVNPWGSGGGAGWTFTGPPPAVPIVNYGRLQTAGGGSLYLIADKVDNHGTISTPKGTTGLLAGQEVMLSSTPDGLSLAVPVRLPSGSVNNEGKIVADAGQILAQAQTVNNSGLVQADSVREHNGVIEFYASQNLQLTGSSVVQANGDASGNSPGGSISLKSGGTFGDGAGSQIAATGGAAGGKGGMVDVSAPSVLSLNSAIDTSANPGWSQGAFSLDPENIALVGTGPSLAYNSGTVNATTGSSTVTVNVNTAFQNITSGQILLEASGNITLNGATTWDLSRSTGRTSGQLTLEAGGNISIGILTGSATIVDGNNWSVTLEAGYNFAGGGGVIPGVGALTVVPSQGNTASISGVQLASGNLSVLVGNNVSVQSGGCLVTGIARVNGQPVAMSSGGGNVSVQALSGNVNCGASPSGYLFTASGYTVDPNLGGISTAAGGNVTIQAGGNISALLEASVTAKQSDSGSGAFGAAPGNVTLTAGGDITGHYVLANGTGVINAVGNAGTSGAELAMSLIKGAWTVNAAKSIYMQEVRNPNGVFNSSGGFNGGAGSFVYNYDPLASVTLNAGNSVTFAGGSPGSALPRLPGAAEAPIYPPILNVNAGAGGINLLSTLNALNLYPSPEGNLTMTTTGGGNLTGAGGKINLSDSSGTQWTAGNPFTSGFPGNNVLHLNDPNPVLLSISGSIENLNIFSPKPMDMYVAGNIIDCNFSMKNLRPSDTSIISVGGEVYTDSANVLLTLPSGETPNFNALALVSANVVSASTGAPEVLPVGDLVLPNPNAIPALEGHYNDFAYDAASRTILFNGKMPLSEETALLAMTTPFLDQASIRTIYTQSQQTLSQSQSGIQIAGPGALKVMASSLSLGNSAGIISQGFSINNPALAAYTDHGADIDLSVSGDISMQASSIASEYGGNINISCGGTMEIGSPLIQPTTTKYPLGIVSLWQGNINVVAYGDINVDGARIATYDGGDIFVESLTGNVNAGAGGSGRTTVAKPYVDANGIVRLENSTIPGSGILATSFPVLLPGETTSHVGDITVTTPEGDIIASRGGIAQLPLGVSDTKGSIDLTAGSPGYVGNVDAGGSGVVGGAVTITATGNINGTVVASVSANVNALLNVNATVLSQGGATVSAGGTVSGTVVAVSAVNIKGSVDAATAFGGGGVSTSGSQVAGAVAAGPSAAPSTAAAATQNATTTATQTDVTSTSDDDLKKKGKPLTKLLKYVGRVTVLLPQ
jgi:filamentous hemagglutinin family protein